MPPRGHMTCAAASFVQGKECDKAYSPSCTLREKPMFKTRTLPKMLNVLLGLSTTATAVFILAGVPTRAVVETALPWMLWLTNETVRSFLGKYR